MSPQPPHLSGGTCDVRPFGLHEAVYSWGRGEDGQLGLGDTNDQDRPVLVEALKSKGVVQVACGSGHTVVLSGECSACCYSCCREVFWEKAGRVEGEGEELESGR